MTEPRRRRFPIVSARFLAVAVLLCGMAYVTYDTQQQVRSANHERADLRRKVSALEQTVKTLTSENRRLTTLLLKAGIDPRPSPTSASTPTVIVNVLPSKAARTASTPKASPSPGPARSPSARPSPTRKPSPTPSPTCSSAYNPLTGRCLTGGLP